MNPKVKTMSLRSSSATVAIPERLLRRLRLLAMTTTFLLAMTVGASPAFAGELANQFSVSLWVNPTTSVTSKALAVKNTEIRLYTDASGYATCAIHNGTDWQTAAADTAALPLNTWSFVSCTYDKTTLRIFVGGVQKGTSALTATVNDAATNWRVGSDEAGTYGDLTGTTDEFKIYNYARTQKQIVEDMLGGGSVIASGGGNGGTVGHWKFDEGYGTTANNSGSGGSALNGTITTATWTNSGKFGKALSFAGRVSVPDNAALDITGAVTYSAWVNYSANGLSNERIMSKGETGTNYGCILFKTSGAKTIGFGDAGGFVTTTTGFGDGNWHHVVGIHDGGNTNASLSIYVDGIKQPTTASASYNGCEATSEPFMISSYSNDGVIGDAFVGLIDEVKIYNYALTSDEVKTDYNQGAGLKMGAVSTESDASTASNAAARGYCIPGDASACSAPVGEWNFEEGSGSSAYDSSGNGNTGTATGTTVVPGKFGKARSFNGSSDYVNAGTGSTLDITNAVTMEAWVYLKSTSGGRYIGGKSTDEWILYFPAGSSTPRVYMEDVTATSLDAGSSINLNQWYHIAFTYDKDAGTNNRKIYINGSLSNQNTATGALGISVEPFLIGAFNTTPSNPFNGYIDGVKVYNYARTATQVAWDYNRGGPVGWWKFNECQGSSAFDSSGNGNTGTITEGGAGTNVGVGNCGGSAGTMWKDGATGKYNSSLEFDGTDDYVQAPDSSIYEFSSGDFSMGGWVKTSSTGGFTMIAKGDGGSAAGTEYILHVTDSTNTFWFRGAWRSSSTFNLTSGAWTHVLVTFTDSDDTLRFYKNGVLVDTISSVTGSYASGTTSGLYIAKQGSSAANYYTGQIDDVQIFNYALTPLQVKSLFNQNSSVRFGPATGSP